MDLRDKIAALCGRLNDRPDKFHFDIADEILAIPEIAEALKLKAHRDTKVGYERQG